MARYDEAGVFDDDPRVFYDREPQQLERRRPMARVSLYLHRMSVPERLAFAQQVITAMTGNANFTTPSPPLAELTTLLTAASAKTQAAEAARQAAIQATTERNTALDALMAALNLEAAYVQNASRGDPAIIQSAGMEVGGVPAPVGPVGQALNFALTAGDAERQLDAQWDPVRGASNYELQTSPDPVTATSWSLYGSAAGSKTVITGLTSGLRLWVRVRAIGAAGPGPWSDPATKIVP
jgi:hypothetical protein